MSQDGGSTASKKTAASHDVELQARSGSAASAAGVGLIADGRGDVQPGESIEYRVYKRRWFGLVQLTLLNVIVSWDWLSFAPVASNAAAYYAVPESAINWLSLAFMFAFVVICPLTIHILHKGPKPSFVTAAALILVGNWVRYGGSHAREAGKGIYGVAMLGQIFTGLAQPFVLAAPTRYSDLWFTDRGRVAATAVATLGNPLGAALGQLINPFWVSGPEDVSWMVLYVAIISSVCTIPAFFIPAAPPTPAAPSSQTPKLPIMSSLLHAARSLEIWLLLIPFAIYVGFFNSFSSLLNQILVPYGFSDDDAGIGGALLILVGLVSAAITSPLIDRTKSFLLTVRICVPIIAISYLIFVWVPGTRELAGPYVILAITGAASFSLMPVALEYLCELSHPVSPEVTSTLAWATGQILGCIFLLVQTALQSGEDADPPKNMHQALVFQAIVAMVAMVPPLCLGLFGRGDKVSLKRVRSDQAGTSPSTSV